MHYTTQPGGVTPDQLGGFFEGWPNPSSPDTLHRLLAGSAYVVLAIEEGGQVVGFVHAVSDGVLSAYIPLLEVRAEWRGQGVATRLMQLLLEQVDGLYMIDTACDDELVPFYERFGLRRANAMIRRDYGAQRGRVADGPLL
ncbi:GNAT family N-acetyltransferase [Deinococcus hohokamensis]|uniref:GNAT family N-acetyltransferase n=1 Tax=Deinococcus hohokamensis TaxID=309883 RepID=A0ABV9ICD0_9DEIO